MMGADLGAHLEKISALIWGPWVLIPLLVGTGVLLTVRLRGLQFRQLGPSLSFAFLRRREAGGQGDISHFHALMTALAATVGTGNIAGVATAIAAGGPGALFWMWVTGLLGMATKYAEALLSVRFRVVDERGQMSGGPMYFLSRGISVRWLGRALGAAFALFAAVAAFGIGNGVQSQEVANTLKTTAGVEPLVTTVALAVLVAAVILGGIRSIARFVGFLVPAMLVFYMGGALAVLFLNAEHIPRALAHVFTAAFSGTAVGGGVLGASVAAAVRFGFARGIFSNESGLGSAGIAAAAAATREPVRQALVSMTQTFIDTLVVCTLTGLVILTAVLADIDLHGAGEAGARWQELSGSQWTTIAFHQTLPGQLGGWIVTGSLAFFAFSTILGWGYYGEKSIQYLLGIRAVVPYRVVFSAMVVIGPLFFDRRIWLVSDITNGLMAIPNLIGLLLLSGVIVSETRAFFERQAARGEPPGS
jgi:AGCS family alanine or glycine:cation symporter